MLSLTPISIPQDIITHLRMGIMVDIMVDILGVTMDIPGATMVDILEATMGDIRGKEIMTADTKVKTLPVDIRGKEIMAVDIGDSRV